MHRTQKSGARSRRLTVTRLFPDKEWQRSGHDHLRAVMGPASNLESLVDPISPIVFPLLAPCIKNAFSLVDRDVAAL